MNNKFILVFLLLGYSFCSFGQDLFEKTTLSHMPEVTILGKTLYADFNGDGNSDIVYYNN